MAFIFNKEILIKRASTTLTKTIQNQIYISNEQNLDSIGHSFDIVQADFKKIAQNLDGECFRGSFSSDFSAQTGQIYLF
ncbi:MAG: hypothetical protein V7L00_22890 [Nostoc sp.]|uniref:hypothetical protein n=1 Tax=unclassified Nostoc TaxID=2593658 RepID=UPI0025F1EB32|nr:hypothetical protein [Nostoc sp. JL33]MBN3873925.1 hypothetical protein [Nostoc sp. JL33]